MKKNQTFIQTSSELLASKIIGGTEKNLIAYTQSFQRNGLTLFASNQKIGDAIGLSKKGVETLITRMNKKYNFFSSTQLGQKATADNWTSSHEVKIDEDKLDAFLEAELSHFEAPVESLPIPSAPVELKPATEPLPTVIAIEVPAVEVPAVEPASVEPLPTVTTLEPSPSATPVIQLLPKQKTKKMNTPTPASTPTNWVEEIFEEVDTKEFEPNEFTTTLNKKQEIKTNEPVKGLTKEQAKAEADLPQFIIDNDIALDKVITYQSDLNFLLPVLGRYPSVTEMIHDDLKANFKAPVNFKEAIPTIDKHLKKLFDNLKTA